MQSSQRPSRVPSYRLHKASNQAVVTLAGRDVYLGPWGSDRSHAEYRRVVAEHLAGVGARARAASASGITVVEVAAAYWRFAETYYRKDGRPTRGLANIRCVLGRLRSLYGHTPAAEFGPLALKALRASMIADDLCARSVNHYTNLVKGVFKWAAGEELVAPDVYHGLRAVAGLRRGRSDARDNPPVRPVADEIVEATLAHAGAVVADMVRIQRLTGMRPAEVCAMTTGGIETAGAVWTYRPRRHKTEHFGHQREIAIGPRAQAVLRGYLRTELDSPIFSPAESEDRRLAERRADRRSPMTPSHAARRVKSVRSAGRRTNAPGNAYSPDSFRKAVQKACERAFPPPPHLARKAGETDAAWLARLSPPEAGELQAWRQGHCWSPNQLRHTRASEVRKAHGLDAAGAVLGHSLLETTQIYAERSRDLALRVALATG